MSLVRLTPIDGEAILPLAECKEHLKVTHSAEDALIGSLRNASIGYVERAAGVALAAADFRWTLRGFASRIDLPVRPVTALAGVVYHDAGGVEITYAGARLIDNAVYAAAGERWPAAYGYAAAEFTAGMQSPDDAPELIEAVKLVLAHFYQHRTGTQMGTVQTLPLGVQELIDLYRPVLI